MFKYETLGTELWECDWSSLLVTEILLSVVCPNMETDNFITENVSSKWPKARVGRKYNSRYFYPVFGIFNKATILLLALFRCELMIADSLVHTSYAI